MAREIAARKRRKAPNPVQGISIALDEVGAKPYSASQNWRHAMSLRTRLMFRRLFVAATLALPLLAASARAADQLRAVREVRVKTPAERQLSRLLDRLKKNRTLVDAGVRTKKMSAEAADKLRKDLAAVERKARALSKRSRGRFEQGLRSLDMELDEIGQKIRT